VGGDKSHDCNLEGVQYKTAYSAGGRFARFAGKRKGLTAGTEDGTSHKSDGSSRNVFRQKLGDASRKITTWMWLFGPVVGTARNKRGGDKGSFGRGGLREKERRNLALWGKGGLQRGKGSGRKIGSHSRCAF